MCAVCFEKIKYCKKVGFFYYIKVMESKKLNLIQLKSTMSKVNENQDYAINPTNIGKVKEVSYGFAVKNFKRSPFNRDLNEKWVSKLKKDMATGDGLKHQQPIVVNAVTGNIIDGNHRFEAFKEGYEEGVIYEGDKLRVFYEECSLDEERDLIIKYQNELHWKTKDYVKIASVSSESRPYIEKLEKAMSGRELFEGGKYNRAAMFMTGKSIRNKASLYLDFRGTDEEIELGCRVHDDAVKILNAFGLPHKGQFITSLGMSWRKLVIDGRDDIDSIVWLMTKNRGTNKNYAGMLKGYSHSTIKDWDFIFGQALEFAKKAKDDERVAKVERTRRKMEK